MITLPGRHVVTGTVVSASYQHELYRNTEKVRQNGKEKILTTASNMPHSYLDLDFLAAASETYQISPDPSDYIIVALPIVTSDVPNRNLQGFLGQELAYFDPMYGCLTYQTFLRKPCHIDHQENTIPHKAKGVHVDASMVYVPKFDVWKINVLTMWDRTKDPKLVQDILDKKRTGYSMGCSVGAFLPVAAGTLISTARGLVPIETIKPGDMVETQFGMKRCDGVIHSGVQKTLTIETKKGQVLRLEPSHPVLVLTQNLDMEWKEAGQIKPGDRIGFQTTGDVTYPDSYVKIDAPWHEIDKSGVLTCAECGNKFNQLQSHVKTHEMSWDEYSKKHGKEIAENSYSLPVVREVDETVGRMLGYLVADGSHTFSATGSNRLTHADDDVDVAQDFESGWAHIFGNPPKSPRRNLSINIGGEGYSAFFAKLGYGFQNAKDKSVPTCIFTSPKSVVISYLAGYFSGDGTVESKGSISFCSTSRLLLCETQLLLARLGIPSTIIKNTNKDRQDVKMPNGSIRQSAESDIFRLNVYSKAAIRFAEMMTPYISSKYRLGQLSTLLVSKNRPIAQWHEEIPGGMEQLRDLQKRKSLINRHGPSLRYVELKDTKSLSYGHFDSYGDLLQNIGYFDDVLASKLCSLLRTRTTWVEVKSAIENPIHEPVYCIKDVEDVHQFVANGLVVHNCSICGAVDEMDHKSCEHMRPKGSLWGRNNTLSWQVCSGGLSFFESSSVSDPADPTACSEDVFV